MRTTSTHSGFTLIEVLVAVFVLALGLLGLAMLQTTSLRFNTNSYSRTQASFLAYDILDRIRANPTAFANGDYTVADAAAVSAAQTTYNACKSSSCQCENSAALATQCDPQKLAQFDLGRWYEQQFGSTTVGTGLLLGADTNNPSTIARNGNVVTITLRWQERDEDGAQLLKTQTWQAQVPN